MRSVFPLLISAFAFGCAASPGPAPGEAIAGSPTKAAAGEGSNRIAAAVERPAPIARSTADAGAGVKAPFEGGQVWVGTYTCAQGLTDLALRVVRVEGDAVDAVFAFEHRPSGARGSFAMHGEYSPAKLELALQAGAWIEQPSNYVTVGLDGYVAGSEFWGTVTNPSCGTFSLSLSTGARQEPHAAVSTEPSRK